MLLFVSLTPSCNPGLNAAGHVGMDFFFLRIGGVIYTALSGLQEGRVEREKLMERSQKERNERKVANNVVRFWRSCGTDKW